MYDTIIIGGGPCGMTAAIYLRRANKSVLMLEKFSVGGQMAITMGIENYPGEIKIDGDVLSSKMFDQCNALGVETKFEEVVSCDLEGQVKIVRTHKNTYEGKTVLICTGASARPLNLANEKSFLGKGLSYCATCDGNFYKNKDVAVVGGGNTSFADCLYLSGLANKVYLVHRREEFRGDALTLSKIQQLKDNGKIEFVLNSVVDEICGNQTLDGIVVKNLVNGKKTKLDISGLFVAIGRKPDTEFLKDSVSLGDDGYIITDDTMQTNISGVYAGGDARNTPFRQIVTACGDGATASVGILKYLSQN